MASESTLGAFTRPRRRSLAAARRRSQLVRALRLLLIAAMLLVVLNAVFQAVVSSLNAPGGETVRVSDAERIINPRFAGRDDSGTPFTLTAASAIRRAEGVLSLIDLDLPALDYAMVRANGEDASQVLAEAGVFDERAQTLVLRRNVRLSTMSGYEFRSETARIHLDQGVVYGDLPVSGDGPWGGVYADTFEVRDDGRHIIFSGDVRTRYYIDRPAPDSSQEAQP